MSGTAPHHARAAALPASVLALFALLCFPLTAQAEPPTYEDNVPKVPGKVQHEPDPKAGDSKVAGGTNSPSGGETAPAGGGNVGKDSSGKVGGAGGDGGGNGKDQGSGEAGDLDDREKVAQATPPAQGVVSGDLAADSSSSSPLVPILIAIAVLAAISVGVIVVRKRGDEDGDDPTAPKAS